MKSENGVGVSKSLTKLTQEDFRENVMALKALF